MTDGILNVYKERGYTSHDVVARLRSIIKQKRIGHTGTLDPEAEGVLPVCLGKATKLCEFLTDRQKIYRAVLLLGRTTDTQDVTGKILSENKVCVTPEMVEKVIASFQGDMDQIPPMYSALKVDGKRLYEYAREGMTVERKARKITIYGISVECIDLPRVTMTVTCSKGTYIRTLCHDIGEKLGCGGCMESLLRICAGGFRVENSCTLEEIEKLQRDGRISTVLFPIEAVFEGYPRAYVTGIGEKRLKNGNALDEDMLRLPDGHIQEGKLVRICDSSGVFCAVYRYHGEKHQFVPVRMFL